MLLFRSCCAMNEKGTNWGYCVAGTVDQKARGAFFTPSDVADYLARWAIRRSSDTVLEPSCGEAVFLSAAATQLAAFGLIDQPWRELLHGVEIHAASAHSAKRALLDQGFDATIVVGDFFETDPKRQFDAIVGNPPFIRYQDFSGLARARSMEAALAQGVRLSGLASSWAAFVVRASQYLAQDGRLALVLPAELLTVGYATEVRSFLLRRFAHIKLVVFEQRIFPGVLEDVVLLLAEGTGGADRFELHQTKNAQTLLQDSVAWEQYVPEKGGKWTPALVARSAFSAYERLVSQTCEGLSAWGRTYLGSVTGNNKFFSLSPAELLEKGLDASELLRISPPGSRHLRGLEFSNASWKALASENAKTYLFYPQSDLSQAAEAHVRRGRDEDVDKAYKCKVRSPWWRVPLVEVPDILLTYMNHDRPRLITNSAKVNILNSLYGIKLQAARRQLGMDLLPLACLNSVTLLGAEVVGRAYGGGLLKLEPREADKLPVPSVKVIAECQEKLRAIRPQLNSALRRNDIDAATRLVDPILFAAADSATLDTLRTAREILFQRRRAKGSNGQN